MPQERLISFFYLKIFMFGFIAIILLAIVVRIVGEIVSSSFTQNSFSVLIISNDSKVIYVDKSTKSATFLAIGDVKRFVKGKSPLEASFALGIPINAIIIDPSPPQNLKNFSSFSNQFRLISSGDNITFKNMDRYDVYKLAQAVRASINDNKTEKRLNIFNNDNLKEIEDVFRDNEINNSPLTLEIENGTSINGLGTDLALILAKTGFNIISVRTSNEKMNSFIAFPDGENKYTKTLKSLVGFEFKKAKMSQAADVTLYLGDDVDALLSP